MAVTSPELILLLQLVPSVRINKHVKITPSMACSLFFTNRPRKNRLIEILSVGLYKMVESLQSKFKTKAGACVSYSCDIKRYRIIPNKGTTLIRAPPIVSPKLGVTKMTKVSVTPLIFVRFLIRNHRWKTQNLSFNPVLSYLTLSERRCAY